MGEEKMQALIRLDSAISSLWDTYKDLRDAHDIFPADELYALASKVLSTMVDVLEVERKVQSYDEI